MDISKEIIKEAIENRGRSSSDFEKLPFYNQLLENIDKEHTNDELEALQFIFEELGRNIAYELIPKRQATEYSLYIDNTRMNHKNTIQFRINEYDYLLLGNGEHRGIHSGVIYEDSLYLEFKKRDKDSVKNVYDEFKRLDDKYHFIRKEEALEKIAEITGLKGEI